MTLTCHCGQIRIVLDRKPDFVNECNCSLCSKSGARWGYFSPDQVHVEGATLSYCRNDKGEPSAQVHFCGTCGSTTHFVLTPGAIAKHGNAVMGVNMALADESDLAGLELRYPDGRGWSGEGAFGFVREPRIYGQ